ncbi:hypothetical protein [Marinoscillum sp. MHG1-6]|uniref:hypothetical protein n=1 Tax=Marinoscillum sp. MHG1-6 TaxID=2959627 RepID=UPI002157F1A9|nr:hypothetical protein [Marinoscillum sp. MHG1-6]
MKMNNVTLISCLLMLCAFFSHAQKKKQQDTSDYIVQPGRIEFDIELMESNPFHIIAGGETGLLLAEEDDYINRGQNWKLHKLDTALNLIWTRLLVIPAGAYYTGYDFYDGKYYMLFSDPKMDYGGYLLYEIDQKTSNINSYPVRTVFPLSLTEFEVVGNFVLLSGHTNYRPVMMVYDFIEKKPKVLPGIYDRSGDIQKLIVNDDMQVFTVLISERLNNKKYTLIAKTFTASGDLIQEVQLDPGDKQNIVDGVSTNFYGGYQYISGTYSKKPSTYSRGLYLSKFVNGRQQFIKYHEYAQLDNFFGYMSTKREKRIKERIKRKAAKGKSAKFNYKLLVHDIIPRGDEFLLIAEAYYPRYSSYYGGSPNYGQFYQTYTPGFIGYNFTHAVVVAFDRNGNIKWDASFGIDNVLSYSLEEFVSVSVYDDEVVLMYLDENAIQSKVVRGDKISEGKTFMPVQLAFEGDEVKTRDPDTEGLKPWYDQTMYAFGEQRIKNDQAVNGKIFRTIFYINKVQYHMQENPK